jgi:hypothetical protein
MLNRPLRLSRHSNGTKCEGPEQSRLRGFILPNGWGSHLFRVAVLVNGLPVFVRNSVGCKAQRFATNAAEYALVISHTSLPTHAGCYITSGKTSLL